MRKSALTLRSIWGLAKCPELQLDAEDLYGIVLRETGKQHMRDMTQSDISRVCRVLYMLKDQARGGSSVYHPRRTDEAGNDATVEQRRRIWHLCKQLGWEAQDQINGFCKRMCKVDRLEWLTPAQCRKVIEGLKAMAARKEAGSNAEEGI